ncbi:MAG TPA: hypothetical protein PLN24_01955 [Victivallales bacterium]|nr:hypothetical protein [Victivallales bacterium]HPO89500.1 hypothetical protein [Victivallales bacterium]
MKTKNKFQNIFRKIIRHSFTLVEIYIAMMIFLILLTFLMPRLYRSVQWAKFNRWLAYNRALSNDPDCVLNFNFQEGKGDIIYNSALGADVENHQADKYNGYLSRTTSGPHQFQWIKSGGRWGKNGYKHALQFNGTNTYILIPGTQGLDFTPEDSFTILTWVKFDKLGLGDCPFSKSLWGTAYDAACQYDLYANPWSGSFGQGSFDVDVFTTCATWTNTQVDFDKKGWIQLALRYKSLGLDEDTGQVKGEITVFVNGEPLGDFIETTEENPYTGTATEWQVCSGNGLNVPLILGGAGCYRKYWSPSTYDKTKPGELSNEWMIKFLFKGKMDEFVVFKRALPDAEIRGHYEMGRE